MAGEGNVVEGGVGRGSKGRWRGATARHAPTCLAWRPRAAHILHHNSTSSCADPVRTCTYTHCILSPRLRKLACDLWRLFAILFDTHYRCATTHMVTHPSELRRPGWRPPTHVCSGSPLKMRWPRTVGRCRQLYVSLVSGSISYIPIALCRQLSAMSSTT